jgi:hypothetical protein
MRLLREVAPSSYLSLKCEWHLLLGGWWWWYPPYYREEGYRKTQTFGLVGGHLVFFKTVCVRVCCFGLVCSAMYTPYICVHMYSTRQRRKKPLYYWSVGMVVGRSFCLASFGWSLCAEFTVDRQHWTMMTPLGTSSYCPVIYTSIKKHNQANTT